MTEPNIPLLRKAVEWVEEQDRRPRALREWNQGTWLDTQVERMLQTDLRFAYEDIEADVDISWFMEDWGVTPEEAENILATGQECGTAYCVAGRVASWEDERYLRMMHVEDVHCSDFARDLLGLSPSDSTRLFHADNSAEDIRRIAEEIAGERL